MSLENGHMSPGDTEQATAPQQLPRSESELSDVNDLVPTDPVMTDHHDAPESADDAMQDMATSQSDDDEDAAGSEDADFDLESPPSPQSNDSRRNSVSSDASSHTRKRKLDVDDDQYMQENPELYGLRRSVCRTLPSPLTSC